MSVVSQSWEYIDSGGQKQGPFTEDQMRKWNELEFFPGTIKVRVVDSGDEFVAIEELKPSFTRPIEVVKAPPEPTEEEKAKAEADAKAEAERKKAEEEAAAKAKAEADAEAKRKAEEEERNRLGNAATLQAAPSGDAAAELHWLYVDTDGNIQGPFSNSVMHQWYGLGHFEGTIKVLKYHPADTAADDAEAKKHVDSTGQPVNPRNLLMRTFTPIKDIKECEFVQLPGSDKSKLQWWYIDDQGKRRGPYPSQIMLRWQHRGLLSPVVRVRSNQQDLVKTKTSALNPDGTPTEVDLFGEKALMNGDGGDSSKKSKKRKRKPVDPVTLMPEEDFVVVSELDTPFGVDSDPEQATWFFQDDTGQERGPYLLSVMSMWFLRGYLPEDVLVRQSHWQIQSQDGEAPVPEWKTVRQARPFFTKMQEDALDDEEVAAQLFGDDGDKDDEEKQNGVAAEGEVQDPTASTDDEIQWYFLDLDEGKPQGPFTTDAMKQWFDSGFIPPFTRVRKHEETHFVPIKDRKTCEFAPEAAQGTGESDLSVPLAQNGDSAPAAPATAREQPAPPTGPRPPAPDGDDATSAPAPASSQANGVATPAPEPPKGEPPTQQQQVTPPAGAGPAAPGPQPPAPAGQPPPTGPPLPGSQPPTPGGPAPQSGPAPGPQPSGPGRPMGPGGPQFGAQGPRGGPQPVMREPDWLYIADDGKQMGPFTSDQMRHWWNARQLDATVRVRQANEPPQALASISSRDCCFKHPPPQQPRSQQQRPQQPPVPMRSTGPGGPPLPQRPGPGSGPMPQVMRQGPPLPNPMPMGRGGPMRGPPGRGGPMGPPGPIRGPPIGPPMRGRGPPPGRGGPVQIRGPPGPFGPQGSPPGPYRGPGPAPFRGPPGPSQPPFRGPFGPPGRGGGPPTGPGRPIVGPFGPPSRGPGGPPPMGPGAFGPPGRPFQPMSAGRPNAPPRSHPPAAGGARGGPPPQSSSAPPSSAPAGSSAASTPTPSAASSANAPGGGGGPSAGKSSE